jgi:predicted DNA-binding protein YlxM (UPF0122 family)
MPQQVSLDTAKALDLKVNHNLSYGEIAAIAGVTRQAIHARLKPLLPQEDEIESFKEYRADILSAAQIKLLRSMNSLDDDETKALVQKRGMVDYGILHDKEMQARGLSDSGSKPMVVIQIKGDNAHVTVDRPVDDYSNGS